MSYNFDQLINRKNSNSIKWDFYKEYIKGAPEGGLPLWVADMDFPCAEPILRALHERTDLSIFGYSSHLTDSYFNALSGWFEKRYSWFPERKSIFVSPGVVTAIALLIRVLSRPGAGIVIQPPVYYPFAKKIKANGRKIINNSLCNKNGVYTINYEDLRGKMADQNTAGLILCSPHNPVGRVWMREELEEIISICRRYNKWIISDEIHSDILRKGIKHYPLEVIAPDYKEMIITCTSPSKAFNMPGLKISNIIINNSAFREAWKEEAIDRLSLGMLNPLSIKALEAAYNESEPWLEEVNDYIDMNVEFASKFISEHLPEAVLTYPEGTYLLWLDLRSYCTDYRRLEELMLQNAGVILDEGYFFGYEGRGFERINAACPRSILQECLERICTVFPAKSC